MAKNGTIAQTVWTDPTLSTAVKVKAVHFTELRTAITALQTAQKNVTNCNCAAANKCQSCQKTTCQSCQKQCRGSSDCVSNCTSNCSNVDDGYSGA